MERVELRGIDPATGLESILGYINETPSMYARRLIVEWFGEFTDGDDSDADYMYQIVNQVLDYAPNWTADFEIKEVA